MSIDEYGVNNDYFQCAEIGGLLCFPCCACKFKEKDSSEMPCRYCGHNTAADDCYNCCLCGELQDGHPYEKGLFIAKDTPARVGPMCLTCYLTISSSVAM